jgi:cytidylate kinase
MAVITLAGEPGCRTEEVARLTAQRLRFEFVSESALRRLVAEEFGAEVAIPDKVYPHAITAILARLAIEHHLVVCSQGMEKVVDDFPGVLRVFIAARESYRVGALMIDHRIERTAARTLLRQLEVEQRSARRRQFGRGTPAAHDFDLAFNAESADSDQIAHLIEQTAIIRDIAGHGFLPSSTEANIQFRVRLRLAKHGITPAGKVSLHRKPFANSSEEIFANLLDYYRIAWEYEPRSFPVQWGKDGKVLESFTPDFYLPEFDIYVELTTMKQANVTRKNRKVKLLRAIYPHINIQVFYQKDFQNLVFKYGLAERPVAV